MPRIVVVAEGKDFQDFGIAHQGFEYLNPILQIASTVDDGPTKKVARTKLIPAAILYDMQNSKVMLVKQTEMPLDAARKLTQQSPAPCKKGRTPLTIVKSVSKMSGAHNGLEMCLVCHREVGKLALQKLVIHLVVGGRPEFAQNRFSRPQTL